MPGPCCGAESMQLQIAVSIILLLRITLILLLRRVLSVVGRLRAEIFYHHGVFVHVMRALSWVWADGRSSQANSKIWTWWHCKGCVSKLILMFLPHLTSSCFPMGLHQRPVHQQIMWSGHLIAHQRPPAVTYWPSLGMCLWSPPMLARDKLSTLSTLGWIPCSHGRLPARCQFCCLMPMAGWACKGWETAGANRS